MKRLAFAIGVLALGFAASTPARADFGVVRFEGGWCRVWANSHAAPAGTGWRVLWYGLPSWAAGESAIKWAIAHHWCQKR
jgi:hypothetical protein